MNSETDGLRRLATDDTIHTIEVCPWCGNAWDGEHAETELYGVRAVVCPHYDGQKPFTVLPR